LGNEFSVNPDSLRSAGAQFGPQDDALTQALAQLKSALAGLNGMCGDDEQGHKFASQYEPKAAQLQEVLGQMALGLGKIGQGLQTMADNYDRADVASQAHKR
jgi:uncharacterized protein YukE